MSLREDRDQRDPQRAEREFERMLEMARIGRKIMIVLVIFQGIYVICQLFHINIYQLFTLARHVNIIRIIRENKWLQPYIDFSLWLLMIIDLAICNRASIFEKMSPRTVFPIIVIGLFLSMLSMMYSITPMNLILFIIYLVSLIYLLSGKVSIVELHRTATVERRRSVLKSPETVLELSYPACIAYSEENRKYHSSSSETGRGYGIYPIADYGSENKHGRDIVYYGYDYSSTGNNLKTVKNWENSIPPS
ncbi:MAG: hypothetical protein GXO26_08175 [Crenarchaeota archaeon]|nr:hypothetical protein [Thermoproteota archaeon]